MIYFYHQQEGSALKNIFQVIEERKAVKVFDAGQKIEKDELMEILELAGKAPSAWNLQHWHFMVIHDQQAKETLLPIAYNQSQVVDASAVIVILGDLEANKNFEPVFGPAVESGTLSEEIKNALQGQIEGAYKNTEYAKLAAYGNASLAAMQLMLVAQAKGWDTCPIGGFNSQAFVDTFKVSDRYVPIMLLPLGKAAKPGRPSGRLNIEDMTTWI